MPTNVPMVSTLSPWVASDLESKRQRDKESKRQKDEKTKGKQDYLSQEGYTVSKSACHNGQSAALLSDSGLVMYFSTLPAPSSSAPCNLAILTRLKSRATPGDSRLQGKISLEGCTPAKMAARGAAPKALQAIATAVDRNETLCFIAAMEVLFCPRTVCLPTSRWRPRHPCGLSETLISLHFSVSLQKNLPFIFHERK